MFCAQCGAAMQLQAAEASPICPSCGSAAPLGGEDEGVRLQGSASPYRCPVCRHALMEATLGDERILYCQECKGMMVTMGSFLELVDVLRTQISPGTVLAQTPDPEELRRRIDCPVCRKTMDTHTYGGPGNVVMDSCETCLMNWLDHGEMRRIAAAANLEGSSGYGPRAIGGGMHPMPSMGVSVALGQSGTFGSTGMGPGAFSTIANSRMDEWTLIENQRRRREVNNFLTDLMASIFGR